ncbi:amidohydrolase family protein [Streptococcus sp. DD12]|uniref:amidohydrolase family protein n=1 Tax=Streptococcus sp. DD12 TaxID=1777880 RepID=UPI00079C9E9A|nr:amidohydrolase family protein [Streptococcus sp. DD12]KXT75528.1 2-amino-3-carboxymuconate-6-semialdehyde decarboxylase [Streptococcus sp. DD12]
MKKIDVFAHVFLPEYQKRMTKLAPQLFERMPFLQNPVLADMTLRRKHQPEGVLQVISHVNVNPEDYLPGRSAVLMAKKANQELVQTVKNHPDLFAGGVAMLALNDVEGSLTILDQVAQTPELLGIQLFSRHLGQSWVAESFRPIFAKAAELDLPIWLHPVFDERKPDNNIVFSWEYEQTQAMLELVQAGLFKEFPQLKIIVHHAGAMVPYFAGRIDHILPEEQAQDFRKFYVDTAILGNPKALDLAVDFFGVERVLFGTDAPLGVAPAGATELILEAIEALPLQVTEKEAILSGNVTDLLGGNSYESNQ